MSLPRPSGLKQPSRIGRPSGLPTARPQTPAGGSSTNQQQPAVAASAPVTKAHSAIAKSARGVGLCPQHAEIYASQAVKGLKAPETSSEDGVVSDDFKIGDRIWVGDNKPGVIAFIGEAQFAPGEWAGVVLDEPIGKNDGSVMGVRYFQCEAKRGVFSRLSKLSHMVGSPSEHPHDSSTSSETRLSSSDLRPPIAATATATTNGTTAPTSSVTSRPSSRLGLSSSKNLSTSSSSLHKAASAGNTPTGVTTLRLPGTMPGGVRVGDRVLVSGSKCGILRYIGETDFAKGVWAGVELDEPLGKNDGAVAGKRYFDCQPLHGLFAPVHKISRAGPAVLTPSPHSRPLMSTSLRSSRERSGSQESVLSGSSTASSVSRSRVRLGVTSLASQATKTGQRPSTLNLSATTAALQKTLKEKEEHIEQLLRERDLERSEVARAAAHVDEAEGQLSSMRSQQDRLRIEAEEQISKYRSCVTGLETEKQELTALLEEERRKVEDLQFQLEEETLKDDGDGRANAAFELQLKEIERQAKKEKDRADSLEKELLLLKQKLEEQMKASSESKAAQTSYLDQIEELTYKLTQSEYKVKAYESSRLEDGAKTSQVSIELSEKHSRVKELEEQLSLQRRELTSMTQQLSDVREELIASNEKRKKLEEHVQELSNKLKQSDDENKRILEELHNANTSSADTQRQLTASKAKAEELASDRSKLELQLSELVKNSGDSSSQLATLSDQIQERNRKIEDLQNDLSNYSQNLAKLEESYQKLQQDNDSELQHTCKNYDDKIIKLMDDIQELNTSVDKHKTRVSQLQENYEAERREAVQHREDEMRKLQEQLSQTNDALNKQHDTTTAHRQMLEKVTSEKDALQYEKQQVEKQLRRTEDEKCAINTELIQTRVEASRSQEEAESCRVERLGLQDRMEKMGLEVEYGSKIKEEVESLREELKLQKLESVREKDLLEQELVSLKAEVEKKEAMLVSLQDEGDKLQKETSKKAEELMQKSLTEADFFKQELDTLRVLLEDSKSQLDSRDFQIAELEAEMEQQNKAQLQQKEILVKEKEESEEKCRIVTEEAKKQSDKAGQLELELQTLKLSEAAVRKEKSTLEGRISQLQTDLDQARQESKEAVSRVAVESALASGDAVMLQLKEESATARGQVDFLNSVIVDLQNKNQELQHRLAAMEDSGIHTNGEFFDAVETPTDKRAPPRLFCDICDMFDLHDTEDCPKQATSDSPEPTRHHGDPKNTRPYCDICEVFGHWTDQCDDEQTF